ncbi:glycoside hydrolase family 18 protein [Sphingobacterium chuzhouense]|uniref:chitinase n=1 Tax=Sphingobacterium chuzhouense TaxID=1742264 RepID=A0ABR7XNR1_9SPHI|nr:glycoside hydrolase family 18 protein [Sphingobacterium chuzhouense]MBD1420810.1 glycoside hydrolase family 18 protein [Sphingobacterium chuzhouense]
MLTSISLVKYLFFVLFLLVSFCQRSLAVAYTPNYKNIPDSTSFISSYIRNSFYENGAIDTSKILHSNDLILLNASIYKDGRLFFELPDNRGTVNDGEYIENYHSQPGVLSLHGKHSQMNAKEDLLVTMGHTAVSAFTFGTWLYIEKWREGTYLFIKQGEEKEVSLRFSSPSNPGLIFKIKDHTQVKEVFFKVGLSVNLWQQVTFVYNEKSNDELSTVLFLNGKIFTGSGQHQELKLPFMQGSFLIGKGLDAKLDNTYLNHTALSSEDRNEHEQGIIDLSKWSHTKTVAFWNYDDPNDVGKDLRSWKNILANIRQTIGQKDITIRLGLIHGDWKTALSSEKATQTFVQELHSCLRENALDGVDFDLEWCVNEREWHFYSNAIVTSRRVLSPQYIISASLHPLYYKISQKAIEALDFVSLQAYGPSPVRFGYETFVQEINLFTEYGIPSNKIVMGLPFYGVASDNRRPLIAKSYRDILNFNPELPPLLDTVSLPVGREVVTLTFNGLETIKKKVELVKRHNLRGVMSWDLATDVPFNHPKSLFREVVHIMNGDENK